MFALRSCLALIGLDLLQLGADLAAAVPNAIDQFLEPNGFQLSSVHLRPLTFGVLAGRIACLFSRSQLRFGARNCRGRLFDDQTLRAHLALEVVDFQPPREQPAA